MTVQSGKWHPRKILAYCLAHSSWHSCFLSRCTACWMLVVVPTVVRLSVGQWSTDFMDYVKATLPHCAWVWITSISTHLPEVPWNWCGVRLQLAWWFYFAGTKVKCGLSRWWCHIRVRIESTEWNLWWVHYVCSCRIPHGCVKIRATLTPPFGEEHWKFSFLFSSRIRSLLQERP